MSDNYLWDQSGEPDEEVQHLESLLSEFRYTPRPLVLPEATPKATPTLMPKATIYSFTAVRYAAIAAVALLALGIGIWLSTRTTTPVPEVAGTTTPTPTATPEQPVAPPLSPAPAPKFVKQLQTTAPKAHFAKHPPKRASRKSLEEEGERAKEKVLYALQITSEKLNLIARKIQTDTN